MSRSGKVKPIALADTWIEDEISSSFYIPLVNIIECAENEQLYKTDLPEADIPLEVLMALLALKTCKQIVMSREK